MKYIEKPTQEEKIYNYLLKKEGKRVSAKDIVMDLWILQYNARIWKLRKKGFHIENEVINMKDVFGNTYKMGFFKLIV